jgi:transcription initiation factor IIE alpha subunit
MEYQSSLRQEHAALIQKLLAEQSPEHEDLMGEQLAERTRMRPDEINEAVSLLVQRGHAACDYSHGRRPYAFTTVRLTPEGRAPFEQPSRS